MYEIFKFTKNTINEHEELIEKLSDFKYEPTEEEKNKIVNFELDVARAMVWDDIKIAKNIARIILAAPD